jgi:hypothetical protein
MSGARRWTFHFTPILASWLNAFECFFSALHVPPTAVRRHHRDRRPAGRHRPLYRRARLKRQTVGLVQTGLGDPRPHQWSVWILRPGQSSRSLSASGRTDRGRKGRTPGTGFVRTGRTRRPSSQSSGAASSTRRSQGRSRLACFRPHTFSDNPPRAKPGRRTESVLSWWRSVPCVVYVHIARQDRSEPSGSRVEAHPGRGARAGWNSTCGMRRARKT